MNAVDLVLNTAAANNAWSAQQAEKQMKFQERMSNTAHQRQIADLKAAGLNPVLSAKLGGASTPSGAMGDTDSTVTSALLQALESVASGAASGAAYGGRRASAKIEGENNPFIYDALHALADALPYRWRKGAHSAINLAQSNNVNPLFGVATVPDHSGKSWVQKTADKIKNLWSKVKPSGEVKTYTDYGRPKPVKTRTPGR